MLVVQPGFGGMSSVYTISPYTDNLDDQEVGSQITSSPSPSPLNPAAYLLQLLGGDIVEGWQIIAKNPRLLILDLMNPFFFFPLETFSYFTSYIHYGDEDHGGDFIEPTPGTGGAPGGGGSAPGDQCLNLRGGSLSYFEIFYQDFRYGEEVYLLEGHVTDRRSFNAAPKFLQRCFFPGSNHAYMFRPDHDVAAVEIPDFPCPSECEGVCMRTLITNVDDQIDGEGYTKTYRLQVNTGQGSYEYFFLPESDFSYPHEGLGTGWQVVRTLNYPIIKVRFVLNPPHDNPLPSPSPSPVPPPPPPPMPPTPSCCSCRSIARMLAQQTKDILDAAAAQQVVFAAIQVALGVLADLIRNYLAPDEANPNAGLQGIRNGLFQILIMTDRIYEAVTHIQTGTPGQVDLSAITTKLQELEVKIKQSHAILGGDSWFSSATDFTPEMTLNPETILQTLERAIYPDVQDEPKEIKATSLLNALAIYQAVSYYRSGFSQFPAELPKTLLAYGDSDENAFKVYDSASFQLWFIAQIDALVGRFPIEIEIQDADPTTEGNQQLKIELPNISETLAEMFGLMKATSINADLSINFLMRLAAEIISVKNSSIITQDYVKANAAYLGYKGNPKKRTIPYAFDPENLDTLDKLLKESNKYVIGWQNEDSETIAAYMMKLAFAAGLTKASIFRGGGQAVELIKQLDSLLNDTSTTDSEKWRAFIAAINDPNSRFNTGDNPNPRVRDFPNPESSGGNH